MHEGIYSTSGLTGSVDDGVLDALAQRTAEGDSHAFEEIFELTSNDLYRFVRGLCGNDEVAEDVVAATYLRAWRSARSYRQGSGNYRRWILRIARNQVTDYWRTSNRTVPIDEMDFPISEGSPGEKDTNEMRREVDRLLAVLTPEQREVVVLRYIDNKSYEEIGKLLGKRQGAVRAQLLRALRHMRKVMNDATT